MSLFHAPCSPGLESVLADELAELGGDHLVPSVGGVSFQGDLLTAYRVCLWSRIALRVYEPLAEGPVSSADDLYNLARTVRWSDYLRPSTTFAVRASSKPISGLAWKSRRQAVASSCRPAMRFW